MERSARPLQRVHDPGDRRQFRGRVVLLPAARRHTARTTPRRSSAAVRVASPESREHRLELPKRGQGRLFRMRFVIVGAGAIGEKGRRPTGKVVSRTCPATPVEYTLFVLEGLEFSMAWNTCMKIDGTGADATTLTKR